MRRDMDLVRHILIVAAESDEPLDPSCFTDAIYSDVHVRYHIYLMAQAGLIDADLTPYKDGRRRRDIVLGLTWAGQDYLAAIEDASIWSKTKSAIANAATSATLAVIKTTAEAVITTAIRATMST